MSAARFAEFEFFLAAQTDVLPTQADISPPGGAGEIRLQVSHDVDATTLDSWLRKALVQYRSFKNS